MPVSLYYKNEVNKYNNPSEYIDYKLIKLKYSTPFINTIVFALKEVFFGSYTYLLEI